MHCVCLHRRPPTPPSCDGGVEFARAVEPVCVSTTKAPVGSDGGFRAFWVSVAPSTSNPEDMMTSTASFDAVMEITPRPPIVFVAGQGSWLTDSEGRTLSGFHPGLGGEHARPFATADRRGADAAGGAPDQLQPRLLQRSDDPAVRTCWRGIAGCIRSSSPTAAPRPTRARSSWRASGARSIAMAPTKSSPWITASMAARSPRWRHPARRNGNSSTSRRCPAS